MYSGSFRFRELPLLLCSFYYGIWGVMRHVKQRMIVRTAIGSSIAFTPIDTPKDVLP